MAYAYFNRNTQACKHLNHSIAALTKVRLRSWCTWMMGRALVFNLIVKSISVTVKRSIQTLLVFIFWTIRNNAICYFPKINTEPKINSGKLNINKHWKHLNFTVLEKNHLRKSKNITRNRATVRSSYHKTQVSCQPLQIHSSAPARLSHTTSWYNTGHTRTYHRGHIERTQIKSEQWHKYTQCGCFGIGHRLLISSQIPMVLHINKVS